MPVYAKEREHLLPRGRQRGSDLRCLAPLLHQAARPQHRDNSLHIQPRGQPARLYHVHGEHNRVLLGDAIVGAVFGGTGANASAAIGVIAERVAFCALTPLRCAGRATLALRVHALAPARRHYGGGAWRGKERSRRHAQRQSCLPPRRRQRRLAAWRGAVDGAAHLADRATRATESPGAATTANDRRCLAPTPAASAARGRHALAAVFAEAMQVCFDAPPRRRLHLTIHCLFPPLCRFALRFARVVTSVYFVDVHHVNVLGDIPKQRCPRSALRAASVPHHRHLRRRRRRQRRRR